MAEVERDENGRLKPGSTLNPAGSGKWKNRAVAEIAERFLGEKVDQNWLRGKMAYQTGDTVGDHIIREMILTIASKQFVGAGGKTENLDQKTYAGCVQWLQHQLDAPLTQSVDVTSDGKKIDFNLFQIPKDDGRDIKDK
jgi:hypothetical protein